MAKIASPQSHNFGTIVRVLRRLIHAVREEEANSPPVSLPRLEAATDLPVPVSSQEASAHHTYTTMEEVFRHHFVTTDFLGNGTYGSVEEVRALQTNGVEAGRLYARKSVKIIDGNPLHNLQKLKEEADILRKLRHRHIVEIVSTYTASNTFAFIMSPVAKTDLDQFLYERDGSSVNDKQSLLRWIGCLATGLAYLHKEKIRHMDIKPANILIKDVNVYFTDFGLAKDLAGKPSTRTDGPIRARSSMYCASEIARNKPRDESSDTFSLGCVFLEMLTVFCEIPIGEFLSHRRPVQDGAFHANPRQVRTWIDRLEEHLGNNKYWTDESKEGYRGDGLRHAPLRWCSMMLQPSPQRRVRAPELLKLICAAEIDQLACNPPLVRNWDYSTACFLGPCCTEDLVHLHSPDLLRGTQSRHSYTGSEDLPTEFVRAQLQRVDIEEQTRLQKV